jgi:hypothetical protein
VGLMTLCRVSVVGERGLAAVSGSAFRLSDETSDHGDDAQRQPRWVLLELPPRAGSCGTISSLRRYRHDSVDGHRTVADERDGAG